MELPEIWLVVLGMASLAARPGICLYLAGASRSKNAGAAVMRVLGDLCITTLAFWAVGQGVMTGRAGDILGLRGQFGPKAFFELTMVLIATGSSLGATLERSRFIVPLVISIVLAGWVVPLAARWVWGGWLGQIGMVDFGGASVLHLSGGVCALCAAICVAPRSGKYNRDGSANLIPGHNTPLAAAGMLLIAMGLLPQIVGSSLIGQYVPASAPAADCLLAAAAAGAASMVIGKWRYGVHDLHLTVLGILGGLVAASAGLGRQSSPKAVFVGTVAGVLIPQAAIWLDLRRKIDDPGGLIAVHLVGGIWGLLATAVISPGPRLWQMIAALAGIGAIGGVAAVSSLTALWIVHRFGGLRVSEADELDGSDLVEHDLNAYPDFQQTSIKSYHLRET